MCIKRNETSVSIAALVTDEKVTRAMAIYRLSWYFIWTL